jgi:hypothetical protein
MSHRYKYLLALLVVCSKLSASGKVVAIATPLNPEKKEILLYENNADVTGRLIWFTNTEHEYSISADNLLNSLIR